MVERTLVRVNRMSVEAAPADLQEFAMALAAEGIAVTLPNVGPQHPVPAPVSAGTSLSAAVLEEREE